MYMLCSDGSYYSRLNQMVQNYKDFDFKEGDYVIININQQIKKMKIIKLRMVKQYQELLSNILNKKQSEIQHFDQNQVNNQIKSHQRQISTQFTGANLNNNEEKSNQNKKNYHRRNKTDLNKALQQVEKLRNNEQNQSKSSQKKRDRHNNNNYKNDNNNQKFSLFWLLKNDESTSELNNLYLLKNFFENDQLTFNIEIQTNLENQHICVGMQGDGTQIEFIGVREIPYIQEFKPEEKIYDEIFNFYDIIFQDKEQLDFYLQYVQENPEKSYSKVILDNLLKGMDILNEQQLQKIKSITNYIYELCLQNLENKLAKLRQIQESLNIYIEKKFHQRSLYEDQEEEIKAVISQKNQFLLENDLKEEQQKLERNLLELENQKNAVEEKIMHKKKKYRKKEENLQNEIEQEVEQTINWDKNIQEKRISQSMKLIIEARITAQKQKKIVASANAATIYNTLFPFQGFDLSRTVLDGAILQDGILQGINFQYASLKKVNFLNCILSNANFSYSNLQQAIFGNKQNDHWLKPEIQSHKNHIICITISPNNQIIASLDKDGVIKQWDMQNTYKNKCIYEAKFDKNTKTKQNIIQIKFCPIDLKEILNVEQNFEQSNDTPIDCKPKSLEKDLNFETEGQNQTQQNFYTLLAIAIDNIIEVHNLEKQTIYSQANGHKKDIVCFDISKEGKYIITGALDNKIIFWTLKGVLLKQFQHQSTKISALAFSFDSDIFVSGNYDGIIYIWNFNQSTPNTLNDDKLLNNEESIKNTNLLQKDKVKLPQISALKKQQNTANQKQKLTNNQNQSLTNQSQKRPHLKAVTQLQFNSKNNLISISQDLSIKVWDFNTLQLKSEKQNAHLYNIYDIQIISQCVIATSGGDNFIKLWDINNFDFPLDIIVGHLDSVTSLQVCKDQETIISASRDRSIKIWKQKLKLNEKTLKNRIIFELQDNIANNTFDCTNAKFNHLEKKPINYEKIIQNNSKIKPIGFHIKTFQGIDYILKYQEVEDHFLNGTDICLENFNGSSQHQKTLSESKKLIQKQAKKQIQTSQISVSKDNTHNETNFSKNDRFEEKQKIIIKASDIKDIYMIKTNTCIDFSNIFQTNQFLVFLDNIPEHSQSLLNICNQICSLEQIHDIQKIHISMRGNNISIPDIQDIYEKRQKIIQNSKIQAEKFIIDINLSNNSHFQQPQFFHISQVDPQEADFGEFLKNFYTKIFIQYVVRNTMYEPGNPIDCPYFIAKAKEEFQDLKNKDARV
ncbi:WD40-repeat-containing domain [Pseudocohnilembus persalinus]|uniref:WD40-repeat-containing domain n=1 Tax=Pseudocohnilembus persalinus TaxID=266149 RepID=A0A0V0QBS9_PSEPJ|nr:WD40-repeat-containing domain [Pseudocohnilembus persalinus]|eukprot:KRW99634.1 WD40-repeat-containing domain [Pseudocohnilembus persalinus]